MLFITDVCKVKHQYSNRAQTYSQANEYIISITLWCIIDLSRVKLFLIAVYWETQATSRYLHLFYNGNRMPQMCIYYLLGYMMVTLFSLFVVVVARVTTRGMYWTLCHMYRSWPFTGQDWAQILIVADSLPCDFKWNPVFYVKLLS